MSNVMVNWRGLDKPLHPWTSQGTVVCTSQAPRDVWLAARKTLIGASDVAAILGVSKYGDEFTVWADKTGQAPPEAGNIAMRRGQLFEDAVVQLWAEHVADFPIETRRSGLMRSRAHPFAGATVDRLSICGMDDKPSRCVIEVKTQVDMREWADSEVPTAFQLQGLWQLLVTGRDHVHYVVLGPRFIPEHRVIRRNDPLLTELALQMGEWWQDCIVGDKRPQPTAKAAGMVRKMFRGLPGAVAYVDDDLAPVVHRALAARQQAAEAQDELDAAVAQIQVAMGEATELRWPQDDAPVATWNTGKTIDGATAAWRKANPDLVGQYLVPGPDVVDTAKLVENHPEVIETRALRYRRTFTWK